MKLPLLESVIRLATSAESFPAPHKLEPSAVASGISAPQAAVDPSVIVAANPGGVLARAWAAVQLKKAKGSPAAVAPAQVAVGRCGGDSLLSSSALNNTSPLAVAPAAGRLVADFTAQISGEKEVTGRPALELLMKTLTDEGEKRQLREMMAAMAAGEDPEAFVKRAKARAPLEAVLATSKDAGERWRAAESLAAIDSGETPKPFVSRAEREKTSADIHACLAAETSDRQKWRLCQILDAHERGEDVSQIARNLKMQAERQSAGGCTSCGNDLDTEDVHTCSNCEKDVCGGCVIETDDGPLCKVCSESRGAEAAARATR